MSFNETKEFKHLLQNGEKCYNGGRWKPSIQLFEVNILQWSASKCAELNNGTYKPKKTNSFTISERGKVREIKAHHVSDRMIYKSFCKYELIPSTNDLILSGNSASQTHKGTDYAIKKFRKDLAHAFKVCNGRDFYIYTFDFHNFFGSIPHNSADELLGSRLSDDGSRKLFRQYLEMFETDIGIGIGGEPSQVIAVAYPSQLDRLIECDPNTLGHGRYMDDGYVIMENKDDLLLLIEKFESKCNELGLILNPKHTKINWMKKDSVTFLKKRTFITETGKIVMRLTRQNVTMELHRIKEQHKAYEDGLMPMSSIKQSFQCWCSYAIKYNSYHSMITVTRAYCNKFNVPWKEAKALWKKKSCSNLSECKIS